MDLKNLIRLLAEEGKTVLISSHILSELEEMCDSLLFIHEGKIIHHGNAEDLMRERQDQVTTVLEVQVLGDPARLQTWADMVPEVAFVEATKNGARLELPSTEKAAIAAVLRRLVQDGQEVIGFRRQERRLEEAFVDIVAAGGSGIQPSPLPAAPGAELKLEKEGKNLHE